jgi:hypothetical protein
MFRSPATTAGQTIQAPQSLGKSSGNKKGGRLNEETE